MIPIALLLVLTLAPTPASRPLQEQSRPSSEKSPAPADDEPVSIKTTLVSVPVTVTDKKGRFIPDLKVEDFTLYDEETQQEIAHFESVDMPTTVVLLMDLSGSMMPSLNTLKVAASAFVNSLRPVDLVIPIAFDSRIQLLVPENTTDRELIVKAIRGMHIMPGPESSTSLYDALQFVNRKVLSSVKGHKVLVLMTDGVDTTSKSAGKQDTLRDVVELDAPIYSVYFQQALPQAAFAPQYNHMGNYRPSYNSIPVADKISPDVATFYLTDLAERSGGRFFLSSDAQLKSSMLEIASELNHQYSLAFYPTNAEQKAKKHKIKVKVNRPDTAVRNRRYYTPEPAKKSK